MRSRLKELLAGGKVALGAQLRLGSSAIAELFSLAGFDWLVIDSEHAPQTPPGIQSQLQGIAAADATPIVRLHVNDPDLIRLYLDMGAMGILAPFVNTADEAEKGARACRYPPQGTRGFGPSRASGYGLKADYFGTINPHVVYLPIIESAAAIDNIDRILAVDGVDSCIVGPADLSISLGHPLDFEHKSVQDAIAAVAAAARRAGKPAGIGVYGDAFDPQSFNRQLQAGFRLLLMGGDEWLLTSSCRKVLAGLAELRNA